jgi:hypothetical protein
MRSSKLVGIVALIAVAVPVAASAEPYYRDAGRYEPSNRYLPQNQQPQTEPRYQAFNKLAEIVVCPQRGRDVIRIPEHQPRLDYLELRAIGGSVAIRDVAIRFADGHVIHTGSRGVIVPGQGRVIDLPPGSAPVVAVVPSYGAIGYDRYDGSAVRLELFGVPNHQRWGYDRNDGYDAGYSIRSQ